MNKPPGDLVQIHNLRLISVGGRPVGHENPSLWVGEPPPRIAPSALGNILSSTCVGEFVMPSGIVSISHIIMYLRAKGILGKWN